MTDHTLWLIVSALCITVSAADAAADAIAVRWLARLRHRWLYMCRALDIDPDWYFYASWGKWQWRWHLLKWIRFFLPLATLLWLVHMPWEIVIFLALWCLLIWRAIYSLILKD